MKVFWEVDMQRDFIFQDGKLPVPNGFKIVPNLQKLMKYAMKNEIQILGSVDRHFKDDLELKTFPPHCMNGTFTQGVITQLDIKDTLYIPHKIGEMGKFQMMQYPEIIDLIKNAPPKILFEKQTIDVFTNPHVGYVLEKLDVTEAIVYGVATEYCVKEAVLGLLKRGIKTSIVLDAIMGIDYKATETAKLEMRANGANFITTKEALQ